MTAAEHYSIIVKPLSVEDGGGFIAIVPTLPGCRSDGETPEQALSNGFDAITSWIEAATEFGRPVPRPQ